MKNLLIVFTLALFMMTSQTAFAVNPSKAKTELATETANARALNGEEMTKKEKKIQKRMKKAIQKMEEKGFDLPMDVDFTDPVDKWMWFWIFGWGIAIVLGALPFGGLGLAGVFGTAGTVCLIIWLVKKFS